MTAHSLAALNGLPAVAYFSMEVGLEPSMPTYSGGLGILAGDTLRAAADLGLPMVGVTLLHRKGYFCQKLDRRGNQIEVPYDWSPEDYLEPLSARVSVMIDGRDVHLRAWRYHVRGINGHVVYVYLLDTALPENSVWDQGLTDYLYGGDQYYRLCQEAVLGVGGVAMLHALGHEPIHTYHMNEGHSALLALALLEEQAGKQGLRAVTVENIEAVRQRCVFTTHTPVPAGHDQFPMSLVRQVLGEEHAIALEVIGCCTDGILNMTNLALYFSRYINGVSMRHEEISRTMFPNYPVRSITNGVHALTWTSSPFRELFDRHIPEWRRDNLHLRYAVGIPLQEIQAAHRRAKQSLLAEVERRTGEHLSPSVMTIGFARRATTYKRVDLIFSDIERLRRIAQETGRIQIICGGKAHPRDEGGKALIRRIFEAAAILKDDIPVVYLEEYDMALAQYLCAGVDLWLNTPLKPYEASGTSGMKAALNGVPSLSVPDGWWIEGCVEGVTGWSIGDGWESDPVKEIASLYNKLEHVILVMYYERSLDYARIMRSAIALNGSFFTAQRMMLQYLYNAYQPPHITDQQAE